MKVHALAFGQSIAPMLLAIGLVLAVVIGANGVQPRELVRLAHASVIARLIASLGVSLLVRAGARALVFPPGAAWVRSAPLPRGLQLSIVATFALAAQAPVVGLALAGHDPALSALLGLVAATLACAPVDRSGAAMSFVSIALVVPALGRSSSVALRVLGALALFALCIRHAWMTAPLRPRVRTLRLRRLPVLARLSLTHAKVLVRERPLVVVRALIASALALLLMEHVRTTVTMDPWDRASALQLGAIVTIVTAGPLVAPVGRVRRAMRRWLHASPTPRVVALLAAILVISSPALSFAAGFGATQARVEGPLSGLGATLVLVLFCLALGSLLVRMEEVLHARRRDARFVLVLATIGLGVVFVVLAALPVALTLAAILLFLLLALVIPEPEVPFADDA